MTEPFDKKKVEEFKAKLEPYNIKAKDKTYSFTQSEIEAANKISFEYYDYLAKSGIAYGYAAKDAATNNGAYGRLANYHLHERALAEGKTESEIPMLQNKIKVSLAYNDATSRFDDADAKGFIPYKIVAQYHYTAFKDQGLSKNAWGGAFLEEFVGSGAWMDLGGYDTSVDIHQVKAFGAVLKNEVSNGISARESFGYLMNSINGQKIDTMSVLGTRSIMGVADALSPFAYSSPMYYKYLSYNKEDQFHTPGNTNPSAGRPSLKPSPEAYDPVYNLFQASRGDTREPSVSNSYQTPWNREQQDVWYTPIPPNDKGGSDNNGNPSEPRDKPKSPGDGTKGSSNENLKEEGASNKNWFNWFNNKPSTPKGSEPFHFFQTPQFNHQNIFNQASFNQPLRPNNFTWLCSLLH